MASVYADALLKLQDEHGFVAGPSGIGIGEFTIYDWGNGAAAAAYNRMVEIYGKEEVLGK